MTEYNLLHEKTKMIDSFDEVTLIPRYSTVKSRKNIDISSYITNSIRLDVPVVAANMNSVSSIDLATNIYNCGGIATYTRFRDKNELINDITTLYSNGINIIPSIGVNKDDISFLDAIEQYYKTILIDVAYANNKHIYDFIRHLVSDYPNITFIVGNIVDYKSAIMYLELGINTLKVGLGPGKSCTTRKVTGVGYPHVQAIINVRNAINDVGHGFLIADGGIRTSGDIVKALAFGADAVMIGSLFAGTEESPSLRLSADKKEFYGNASAKTKREAGLPIRFIEGTTISVDYQGHVCALMQQFKDGIRSGMSYMNAHSISELRTNLQYYKIY